VDIPLNEEGIEQAYETAEALRDIEFDQVWTSDLQRARRVSISSSSRALAHGKDIGD
jgi:broad specificity phosphatase PhoE